MLVLTAYISLQVAAAVVGCSLEVGVCTCAIEVLTTSVITPLSGGSLNSIYLFKVLSKNTIC